MGAISIFSSDLLFLSANLKSELQITDSGGVRFSGLPLCSDVILYKTVYLSKRKR